LHIADVGAAALEVTVDRADRLAETGAAHDGLMARHASGARVLHPEPERCLPRGDLVLREELWVGLEREPERRARRTVVEVPAQLQRTAAEVLLARRTRASCARRAEVVFGNLVDEHEPSRFVSDVREKCRRFSLVGNGVGRIGEGWKAREGLYQ